jgi:glycine hydroxymethyltransferase
MSQSSTLSEGFFATGLAETDPAIAKWIGEELGRQAHEIELIASENIVSRAVLQAQGSILTNKYAEGYPGKRYYGGCEFVDEVETLAIDRAKALFGCEFANVQPSSGSQANQAVFTALIKPGDPILGMSLDAGGHLTHGAKANQSGKWFAAHSYGVRLQDGRIDFDEVRRTAKAASPKIIIAGGSAYSRTIDFAAFRQIASPVGHAHVVTTTTHKTLRGPRGGMVLTNDADIAKKVNSAVFPGIQGGPLMHVIAGKAVAFGEALKPAFKAYAQAVIDNANVLAQTLKAGGLDIVSGGTDTHLMLVDLRPKGVKGNDTEKALERAYITCNKNGVPSDPEKPMVTSGVRVGSPAATTRGFGKEEFKQVGAWIIEVVDALARGGDTSAIETKVREEVKALTARFPIYSGPWG